MAKKFIIVILIISAIIAGVLWQSSKKTVNIVYMADSKYVPYVMVSLYSAIENKHQNTKYNVHIIAKDFTSEDIRNIRKLEQKNMQISIYPAKELKLDFSHLGRFGSFEIALQKLFIAEYLNGVEKALYLDADTLVQEDLMKIYKTDIGSQYAAAVKDGLMYQFPEHIAELSLKNKEFYFNSGVMLLNLEKIRKDAIIQKAIIYFNTHNDVFGDQDVLNVIFAGRVKPLSYRYNCNSVFFEEKNADFLSAFWNETVLETPKKVYENAAILHFAGHKPWTEWFQHPFLRPLWWKYANNVKTKYGIDF